jgi:RNA polymerase sigma-70 factor (ECF subfamily)
MAKKENGLIAGGAAPLSGMGLFRACYRRDLGAWEQFLAQYGKLIYYGIHRTLALRHYKAQPEEVEDLFNDVLVHLIKDDCKKLAQFRGESGCSPATWIRTVTVHYIIDYLRQQAHDLDTVEIEEAGISEQISLAAPVPRPDEIFEEKEDDRLFRAAIAGLSENDRYFMELYYSQGQAPERIAQLMGISVKTVYSRVNRVKMKLQETLDRQARK